MTSNALVIHEDDEFLVVNKPPGMIVHEGSDSFSGSRCTWPR